MKIPWKIEILYLGLQLGLVLWLYNHDDSDSIRLNMGPLYLITVVVFYKWNRLECNAKRLWWQPRFSPCICLARSIRTFHDELRFGTTLRFDVKGRRLQKPGTGGFLGLPAAKRYGLEDPHGNSMGMASWRARVCFSLNLRWFFKSWQLTNSRHSCLSSYGRAIRRSLKCQIITL